MPKWQDHGQFPDEQWQEWLDYQSDLNLGFLCGSPSGLLCIDIDDPRGKELLNEHDPNWRDTWQFRTGRGLRCLYRHRETTVSTIVSGRDTHYEVLGDGRQSVLPPSVHPNGKAYRWVDGLSPKDREPADGATLLQNCHSVPTGEITSDRVDWSAAVRSRTGEGSRNIRLTSLAGHLLHPGPLPAEEAFLWLSLYNKHRCDPPLPDQELKSIISSIRRREEVKDAEREQEIKRLMRTYDVNRQDAERMLLEM